MNRVSELEIAEQYFGEEIEFMRKYNSPFRIEGNPSFNWTLMPSGRVMWRDWGDGEQEKPCSVFDFIMKLYNCSYTDALDLINRDFNLNLGDEEKEPSERKPIDILGTESIMENAIEKKILRVEIQPYTNNDLVFWNSFGISLETLATFNVLSTSKVWINNKLVKYYRIDRPIFSYLIRNGIYKIYDPMAPKEFKWLFNGTVDDIMGINQLPEKGNYVVVTKSLKDVMLFYEYGVPACSLQSESPTMPNWLYKTLTMRFNNVFAIFDNDAHGLRFAAKLKENHPLVKTRTIPINYMEKDISDFYKSFGRSRTEQMVQSLITN